MMWIHLVTARSFIRHQSWRLLGPTLVTMLVGLVACLAMLVLAGIDRDIRRTAEDIKLDVVMRDSVQVDRLDEFQDRLVRRPDILRVEQMSPDDVWTEFQRDIGVRSEGLSEIAAMPTLVRLTVGADHMTRRHVVELTSSLRRSYGDVVESTIVPQDAVLDIERRRADLHSAAIAVVSVLFLLCILATSVTGRRLNAPSDSALRGLLGRSNAWFRVGRFGAMTVVDVIGGLLAAITAAVLAPSLTNALPWIDLRSVVPIAAWTISAVTVLTILCRLTLAIWPFRQQRG